MKIVAEGYHPLRYFTDNANGGFNTFDFSIVIGGLLIRSAGENTNAISAIRMLRLVRLLTFIKGVQQVVGLVVCFDHQNRHRHRRRRHFFGVGNKNNTKQTKQETNQ